ncbi:hypothetical protein E4T56_gene5788, partial [Termitomyces sp. T112]
MGISGSAGSTAAANFAGAALMLGWIYARDLPLRLRGGEWAYLRPRGEELRFIIAKGLPMGAQMLLVSSAGLVMVGLVNREGVATAAAYGASMQLWNYLQMPAFAIASAVSAMVAQNVGAGLHKRVSKINMRGLIVNETVTVTLAVLIVIFDGPLLQMFLVRGSPSIPIAQHMQPIVSVSFVLFGIMMILTGTMRAYGAVIIPLIIMFVAMYPARRGGGRDDDRHDLPARSLAQGWAGEISTGQTRLTPLRAPALNGAHHHLVIIAVLLPEPAEGRVGGGRAFGLFQIVKGNTHRNADTLAANDAFAVAQGGNRIQKTARALGHGRPHKGLITFVVEAHGQNRAALAQHALGKVRRTLGHKPQRDAIFAPFLGNARQDAPHRRAVRILLIGHIAMRFLAHQQDRPRLFLTRPDREIEHQS